MRNLSFSSRFISKMSPSTLWGTPGGQITLDCGGGPDCEIISIDDTCPGELGGNVTVSVDGNNCDAVSPSVGDRASLAVLLRALTF